MTFKSEVNERIRAYSVRVLDENNEQKGIMNLRDALAYASSVGLDLVKIADSNPPVCRVVDANKFLYEQKKQQKAAEKKQREAIVAIKEIQLRAGINSHDLKTKARKAKEFLAHGDKVKIVLRFRGREVMNKELGYSVIRTFIAEIGEHKVEKPASESGKDINMLIAPIAKPNKLNDN